MEGAIDHHLSISPFHLRVCLLMRSKNYEGDNWNTKTEREKKREEKVKGEAWFHPSSSSLQSSLQQNQPVAIHVQQNNAPFPRNKQPEPILNRSRTDAGPKIKRQPDRRRRQTEASANRFCLIYCRSNLAPSPLAPSRPRSAAAIYRRDGEPKAVLFSFRPFSLHIPAEDFSPVCPDAGSIN